MNLKEFKEKTLANQDWLEKAVLTLDENNAWNTDVDKEQGSYIARWIKAELGKKVRLGNTITTDDWLGRARNIVGRHITSLLKVATAKAQQDVVDYTEKVKQAKARFKKFKALLRASNGKKKDEKEKSPVQAGTV